MSAKYNIVIDQGSDYNLKLTLSQDSVGLDLTGYAIRGKIKQNFTSATSVSFSATTIDATIGEFMVELTASTTAAMSAGKYVYDIEIYKDPYVTRILEGSLLITPEVTT